MACPTCDHTMHNVNVKGLFWCFRCGTLKNFFSPGPEEDAEIDCPTLVPRVKEFLDVAEELQMYNESCEIVVDAHRIGVYESVGRTAPERVLRKKKLRDGFI